MSDKKGRFLMYKFMWLITALCCLGSAVIMTPIIMLDGAPWWVGLPYAAYFFIGLNVVLTPVIWLIDRLWGL